MLHSNAQSGEVLLPDSLNIEKRNSTFNLSGFGLKIPKEEINPEDLSNIFEKYKINSWYDKRSMEQQVKFYESPKLYIIFLISMITWMMLIIQPIFAIFLKLFYYKTFYYSDHLVHLLFGHGSIFLMTIVILLINRLLDFFGVQYDLMIILMGIISILWVLKSYKSVYNKKWWIILLKAIPLQFIYVLLIFIFLLITMALSFVFF